MAKAKTIVVTGISGSGSRAFCEGYKENGKSVKRYHTGDMVYELAQGCSQTPIAKENLLNLHPHVLGNLRDMAFEQLTEKLNDNADKYDRIFVDTHAQFFWNQIKENAYNWKHLDSIPADMFVTIIDKPSSIKERQMASPMGRAQTHDLRDLLIWQNDEANVTGGWAEKYAKPMYILPSKQNPKDIDSLLENRFLIYSSFPMTDAAGESAKKIIEFKDKLKSLRKDIDGVETSIIDPAHIDIEDYNGLSEREKEAISRHTVYRDLVWYIGEATHVVAYYPDEKISLSKGVSDECTRALETGKYVYVICPRKNISPFMEIAHKVFRDEEEFFKYFKEHMKISLDKLKR